MGREPKQAFFQRRHAGDQLTHEKMLITNHQRNENQNYSEMSPHTCQNGSYRKRQEIMSVGEDVEKKIPYALLVGM